MFMLKSCILRKGSPTSTEMMASVLYVKLKGIFYITGWGAHLYVHKASSNTSIHFPLATPNYFLSSFNTTLLLVLP